MRLAIASALLVLVALSALAGPAAGEQYVVELGSKSNPNAHLFAYDQKWRESTALHNYPLKTSASKEFTDATRLSTRMDLLSQPNVTEINIDADFIGIGRIGYLVLDSETGDVKDEMSRINHMFVGNFTIEEKILVAKDHMCEDGYLPCA
ncbi:MAG TPA: hypothetical protein PLN19_07160 [Methanothrix sp.]|jgi:hypothetical protein|nr:hypothetical protein [Methanothrix sp.]HOV81942.1 hypothetical protein [Methanothrix sp.]HPC89343.1 hypothetical protein [Methanothrix sp.]HQE88032.1 hypothetical protein [Methanothrix sp.]HQI68120.1 hypothetical protein [Methanothrix sp.]